MDKQKVKNKNNCQISFFSYFIFKNYFQISFEKLFSINKQNDIITREKNSTISNFIAVLRYS